MAPVLPLLPGALDEWVLEEACRQVANITSSTPFTLAVNLTPGHLLVADLLPIHNLVEKSGLPAQRLCISSPVPLGEVEALVARTWGTPMAAHT